MNLRANLPVVLVAITTGLERARFLACKLHQDLKQKLELVGTGGNTRQGHTKLLPGSPTTPGPEAGCAAEVRRQQAQQRAQGSSADEGAPQVPGAPLGQAAAPSQSKALQVWTTKRCVADAGSLL